MTTNSVRSGIRLVVAHVLAAVAFGWLLFGCRCPKPSAPVSPPPIVTVAPAPECIRPVRPARPPMFVEAIDDGRLAASQFLWADIVRYVAESQARMDADDACLEAP